jgi:hypothetical protein
MLSAQSKFYVQRLKPAFDQDLPDDFEKPWFFEGLSVHP